jgi:hypothetical protein
MSNFGSRRRIKNKRTRKYYFENNFQVIVKEFYFTDEASIEC